MTVEKAVPSSEWADAWRAFKKATSRLHQLARRDGSYLEIKVNLKAGARWIDGGYLGNNHCPFMLARTGASCALPYQHAGQHRVQA